MAIGAAPGRLAVNAKRVYRLYRETDLQLRHKTGEGQAAGGPPTGDTIQ
jgi:hypothetical protein